MTTQANIINDLGIITKIPNKILDQLVEQTELCIGSAIHDAIINNEEIVTLNIGIGTLSVEVATHQCKFIPNKDLKNIIKKSISNKIDPLETKLEQDVVDKLLRICDEVL